MRKIALCFFGLLRSYKYVFESYKNIIKENKDCEFDIFISTSVSSVRGCSDGGNNNYNYEKESTIRDIQNIFGDKIKEIEFLEDDIDRVNQQNNLIIEASERMKKAKADGCVNFFGYDDFDTAHVKDVYQFYKIYRVNELKKKYETKNNFIYDFVICTRPDLYLTPKLNDDFLWTSHRIKNIFYKLGEIDTSEMYVNGCIIMMSNSYIMNQISEMIFLYGSFLHRPKGDSIRNQTIKEKREIKYVCFNPEYQMGCLFFEIAKKNNISGYLRYVDKDDDMTMYPTTDYGIESHCSWFFVRCESKHVFDEGSRITIKNYDEKKEQQAFTNEYLNIIYTVLSYEMSNNFISKNDIVKICESINEYHNYVYSELFKQFEFVSNYYLYNDSCNLHISFNYENLKKENNKDTFFDKKINSYINVESCTTPLYNKFGMFFNQNDTNGIYNKIKNLFLDEKKNNDNFKINENNEYIVPYEYKNNNFIYLKLKLSKVNKKLQIVGAFSKNNDVVKPFMEWTKSAVSSPTYKTNNIFGYFLDENFYLNGPVAKYIESSPEIICPDKIFTINYNFKGFTECSIKLKFKWDSDKMIYCPVGFEDYHDPNKLINSFSKDFIYAMNRCKNVDSNLDYGIYKYFKLNKNYENKKGTVIFKLKKYNKYLVQFDDKCIKYVDQSQMKLVDTDHQIMKFFHSGQPFERCMKLISYRGNLTGRNIEKENTMEYIKQALDKDYYVMIDVWFIEKFSQTNKEGSIYFKNKEITPYLLYPDVTGNFISIKSNIKPTFKSKDTVKIKDNTLTVVDSIHLENDKYLLVLKQHPVILFNSNDFVKIGENIFTIEEINVEKNIVTIINTNLFNINSQGVCSINNKEYKYIWKIDNPENKTTQLVGFFDSENKFSTGDIIIFNNEHYTIDNEISNEERIKIILDNYKWWEDHQNKLISNYNGSWYTGNDGATYELTQDIIDHPRIIFHARNPEALRNLSNYNNTNSENKEKKSFNKPYFYGNLTDYLPLQNPSFYGGNKQYLLTPPSRPLLKNSICMFPEDGINISSDHEKLASYMINYQWWPFIVQDNIVDGICSNYIENISSREKYDKYFN